MSLTASLKLDILQKLLSTEDDKVLMAVQKILNDANVANIVSEEPLTEEDYNRKITEAERSIKDGKTYTTEQVREQVKKWKIKETKWNPDSLTSNPL